MYVQEGSAMRTSEQGKDFIKACEGCCLSTYKCPGGKLTIGYGHTGAVQRPYLPRSLCR